MAAQSTFKRILTFVANGIALIAAVLAIGGTGWYLAIAWHKVNGQMEASLLMARLAESQLEIQTLQARARALESEKQTLNNLAQAAMNKPTDKDWADLCTRSLELYGGLRRATLPRTTPEWARERPLASIMKEYENITDQVDRCVAMFTNTVVGAGLLASREVSGVTWYYFPKNPAPVYLNGKTWELKQGQP